jgi:Na+/citrate or Na+/malate symporter
VPFLSIIVVCATMISYLSIYYDKLANDQVADYYNMFSQLCTLFLVIQLGIIFTYCHKSINEKCMSNTTIAVLNVLGLIQFLFVITIGIVLKFYSTQG